MNSKNNNETTDTHLYLSHRHLAQSCAHQFGFLTLADGADCCTSALHVQLEYVLRKGKRHPNGYQHNALYRPAMVHGVLNWHHLLVGHSPDACLVNTPLEMLAHRVARWWDPLCISRRGSSFWARGRL